ncbi:MAG: enoyl-CoA hydratase/isomerase family protein [Phycisphaerales bacterium]|nr:enoyl-CoA hydratase/isomerase family protein [Phycisphaerales bacterium]
MSTPPTPNTAAAAPLATAIDADKVITMTLEANQGPMCILDEALIRRIEATLKALPRDATGLILASASPRVFVAGADLKSIIAMSHDDLDRYLAYGQRVFGMLCDLPYVTVAAINGAALGGGLELAMHCDGLVASPAPMVPGKDGAPASPKPYPVGLPEAGLSICPGWGGTNLLPARVVDIAEAMRRTCTGKTWTIDSAMEVGLFDAVSEEASTASLLGTAKSWLLENRTLVSERRDGLPLHWLGRDHVINQAGIAIHEVRAELGAADPAKSCLEAMQAGLAGGRAGWDAALKVEREQLNRLRAAPVGKGAIDAFLTKK